MKINPRDLKYQASLRLVGLTCKPQKLVLIHTAVAVAVTMLVSLMNLFLNMQVAQTGGLEGMQAKALWETTRSLAETAQTFLLPFWNVGIFYVVLRFARGKEAEKRDLGAGFTKFTKVLPMLLWQFLLYLGAVLVIFYIASVLIAFASNTDSLNAALGPIAQQLQEKPELLDDPEFLRTIPLESILPAIALPLGLSLLVAVVVLGFLSYRLRLCSFFIMDNPELGGLNAVRRSWRSMKGNILAMIQLDLSFWWYYGLQLLLIVVSSISLVLTLLGAPQLGELPAIGFQFLYGVGLLVLAYWKGAYVQTTYALAYEEICANGGSASASPRLRAK